MGGRLSDFSMFGPRKSDYMRGPAERILIGDPTTRSERVEIRIESPHFSATPPLGRYLKTRLKEQLAFCGERVRQVEAHFSDINGRRGGADKRCRLVVRLSRSPEVVVESTESDLYLAIRRAADRMTRALQRRIGRQASRRRTQRPIPAVAAALTEAADDRNLNIYGDDDR